MVCSFEIVYAKLLIRIWKILWFPRGDTILFSNLTQQLEITSLSNLYQINNKENLSLGRTPFNPVFNHDNFLV
jgi:hypothetical protein